MKQKKISHVPPAGSKLPCTGFCLYWVRIHARGFMAVFSSSFRTLAWGSPVSCVDLSRITLTTTSARPLGKFSSVLPIHLSSFLSTQRGHSVGAFRGVNPSQGDSVPTVKTWTHLRGLGGVSVPPVPAVPSTRHQPPSLPPQVVSLISECITLQIMPTLFPDGSQDLGRIPEGPA